MLLDQQLYFHLKPATFSQSPPLGYYLPHLSARLAPRSPILAAPLYTGRLD